MNRFFELASADLVVPNKEAWALLWDFTTLREIVDTLPGNTSLQNKALSVANEIMNVFQKGDPSNVKQARELATQVFGPGWEAKREKIYDEDTRTPQIWGIGQVIFPFTSCPSNGLNRIRLHLRYCHIDLAWGVSLEFLSCCYISYFGVGCGLIEFLNRRLPDLGPHK
jgi:hypothetical protein